MGYSLVGGFYSIACADKPGMSGINPDTLMVRARVRIHLSNLKRQFPSFANSKILSLPGRGYGFRLIVPDVRYRYPHPPTPGQSFCSDERLHTQ